MVQSLVWRLDIHKNFGVGASLRGIHLSSLLDQLFHRDRTIHAKSDSVSDTPLFRHIACAPCNTSAEGTEQTQSSTRGQREDNSPSGGNITTESDPNSSVQSDLH